MILINEWMLIYCGATLALFFRLRKVEIRSNLNCLYFVVDFVVKRVIIANKHVFDKGLFRCFKAWISLSDTRFNLSPLIVESLSLIFPLGNAEFLQCLRSHFQSRLESLLIYLFQNCSECNQWLLQDFMPMVFRELNNDRYEDGEGLILVSLEYVEEVVILEEAHRAVSYL